MSDDSLTEHNVDLAVATLTIDAESTETAEEAADELTRLLMQVTSEGDFSDRVLDDVLVTTLAREIQRVGAQS